MNHRVLQIVLAAGLVIAALPAAAEEEEKNLGWATNAELSWVVTSGNSESDTLGFKADSTRSWDRSSLVIKAGAVRADTTTFDRFAISQDPNDPDVPTFVQESKTSQTTAEIYYFGARYGRKISDRFFWFVGGGWDRNRPAGIDGRYLGEAGVGNIWWDRDDLKFRTDYAVTYTDRRDVVEVPYRDEKFAGARFSWKYLNKFGKSTTYTNDFIFDYNFKTSSDWRGDMVNALAVAMSEKLALKASLQWLYANEPAFESVPVLGSDPARSVPYQLDKLDSIFTTSLVITF